MKKLIVLMLLLFSVFSVHAETLETKAVTDKTIDSVHVDNSDTAIVDSVVSIGDNTVKSITGENKNNLVCIETGSLSVMSIDNSLDIFAYFSDSNMNKSDYIIQPSKFTRTNILDNSISGGGQLSDSKRI